MKITIIGCGNMGAGIAKRLSKLHQLFLYDSDMQKVEILAKEGYGNACSDLSKAVNQAEVIILAIKPQNLVEIAKLIGKEFFIKADQILLSMLAGTTIAQLKQYFSIGQIVRIMPNLALIYGEGAIAISTENMLDKKKQDYLNQILKPFGQLYWISENKIDAFTSLAGSGPAFIFVMIEAMVDAGIEMGFSAAEAQSIVHQMIKGSIKLLEETKNHPGELKWQVASPGGTTIAGLKKMEEEKIRSGIINTFYAAYQRALELGSDKRIL